MRHFLCLLLCAGWTLTLPLRAAEPVSVLAPQPDWSDLQPFQRTITRAEFLRLLDTVYAPDGAWRESIEVGHDAALIHQPGEPGTDFRLEFAPSAAAARPIPRYWSAPGEHKTPAGQPLAGYTIALDPGHLGGRWAQMEERWFKIDSAEPVMEGEIVWRVAEHLKDRLAALGARVVMVRGQGTPVTSARPRSLRREARAELERYGVSPIRNGYDGPNDPQKTNSIVWQSELLFYRVSEIRARAHRVNEVLRPDLTICLHCNAEEWGDPARPQLVDKNHLHLLVNGTYHPGELEMADTRHDMLLKLLNRSARVEIPLSERVAASMARATGLPPYEYHSGKARVTAGSPYVWMRNLLANRLYLCPVVYCEPYVMNSQVVFDRIQLGDYEGTRLIDGVERKSLYREYADSVAEGVADYFSGKSK